MATEIEVTTGACDSTLVDKTCTNSFFKVRTGFVNQSGGAVDLDAVPNFTAVYSRTRQTQVASTPMTSTGATGVYEIILNLDDWAPGTYTFSAVGTIDAGATPVRVEGAFEVTEPTREQMLVQIVKSRLHDLDAQLYKLDLPIPKWSMDEIMYELRMGLSDLNSKPPMSNSRFDMRTAPPHFLVQFAFAQVLLTESIMENANTFTLGDGSASLTINRAGFMKDLGQAALQRYDNEALAWKKSLRPRFKGQGSSLFPLQIRRAIGFLPNMKQVFGP